MKQEIIEYLQLGYPYSKIVKLLGCSKATISYHAKKLGIPRQIRNKYDWNEIANYYNNGHSRIECLNKFNFAKGTWDKAVARGDIIRTDWILPMERLLVNNRPQTSRNHLKSRLIKEGYIVSKCLKCELTSWLDKPLSLQLHHKNGVKGDNRIENLCLLCPNCHSQTPTFAGKNNKKST